MRFSSKEAMRLAKKHGLGLRQSYARGRQARLDRLPARRPRQAVQAQSGLRTCLGRVLRDIVHKTKADAVLRKIFAEPLSLRLMRR